MEAIYTAILIEPRKHKALNFVLRNFLENLDNRWKFTIYHGTENKEWLNELLNLNFEKDKLRIQLVNLGVVNLSIADYNLLLTSPKFIEEIPTETFLIFQTDSMICSPHKDLIYKFLKYDYVGAPWSSLVHLGSMCCMGVGNGGLSLRKRSKMLEIVNNFPYKTCWPEDVYFSGILPDFPIQILKPTIEEATEFAIETIPSPRSFGIHSPWYYIMDISENQCPGYNVLKGLNLSV